MRVTRGISDSHDRDTHHSQRAAAVIRSDGGRLQLTA
jgi:hypothetical protein